MRGSRVRSAGDASAEELDFLALLPPSLNPEIAAVAVRLMTRAEAMGLVDVHDGATALDLDLLYAALNGFAEAGIGRAAVVEHSVRDDLRRALVALNDEVEQSPWPPTEWPSMLRVFADVETLARMVGAAPTSVRRYAKGERDTPDDVAARLHFLAMLVADLAGSYNSFGIRRWFTRRRTALGGRSPADVLGGAWDPDDEGPQAVRSLAASLVSPLAT